MTPHANVSITVLMTVYNAAPYIREAVESVLAQTYTDFEFLIVNDASTDQTLTIIESYRDARIRIINNLKNIGQTCSLNVGLHHAKGTSIARMDGDDIVYASWLQDQINVLKQHPSCAVLSPSAVFIDAKNRILKERKIPFDRDHIILKAFFASPINHVGCLMRRDIVLSVGGYDEDKKIVADYGLWCKLIRKKHDIVTHPTVLVAVRTHAHSISIMEADKKVMPEMMGIIKDNVSQMTQDILTDHEAKLLWAINDAGASMMFADFTEGIRAFRRIYSHVKPEYVANTRVIQHFVAMQERVFFLKRIWGFVQLRDYQNIRSTSWEYVTAHGPFNMFLFIWLGSYVGVCLTLAVNVYQHIIANMALKKVQR